MSTQAETLRALVPVQMSGTLALPEILQRAGQAAVFAAEEFF